jgi:hypothetical protein
MEEKRERERERKKKGWGNKLRTNWAKIVKSVVPCLLSCVSKLLNQVIIKLDALKQTPVWKRLVERVERAVLQGHAMSSQSGPTLALYFPPTFHPLTNLCKGELVTCQLSPPHPQPKN